MKFLKIVSSTLVGQLAIKRKIENICATTLHNIGFEEIVTPIFSYHQHLSFEDERYLLHLHDADNETITLRADSTADVVRIVTKRLGRTTGYKKWFYIQPSLIYPHKGSSIKLEQR